MALRTFAAGSHSQATSGFRFSRNLHGMSHFYGGQFTTLCPRGVLIRSATPTRLETLVVRNQSFWKIHNTTSTKHHSKTVVDKMPPLYKRVRERVAGTRNRCCAGTESGYTALNLIIGVFYAYCRSSLSTYTNLECRLRRTYNDVQPI